MFTNRKNNNPRTVFRGIAAAILLAFGIGGAAAAAPAPESFPDSSMDGKASITIHKLSLEERPGVAGNGLPVSGFDAATTIDGVTFQVRKVSGIDLTTQTGWTEAANLAEEFEKQPTADTIKGAYDLLAPQTSVTGAGGQASGQAVFSNLELGVYLVEETATPAGVISSDPFVITVPLTHPVERDSWLYDIHVYPKNQQITGEKTIDDSASVIAGNTVKYTINAPVPSAAKSDYYMIQDELPLQTQLNADSIQVSLSDGTKFTAGAAGHYELKTTEQTLHVELTQKGLDQAYTAAQKAPVSIVVEFEAAVRADVAAGNSGEFTNTAQIYPNRPSWNNQTPMEPSVESRWGSISVKKVNSERPNEPLPGAVFQLWYGPNADFDQAQPLRVDQKDPESAPLEWVSNAEGAVEIPALRYSGWENGESVAPGEAGYRYYWLVETEAPAGFTLLSEPVGFVVDAESATKQIVVQNIPETTTPQGPPLPSTGVMVGILLPLAALLVIGGVVAVRHRRNQESAA